jgi:hypothetical protein
MKFKFKSKFKTVTKDQWKLVANFDTLAADTKTVTEHSSNMHNN